MAKWREQVAHSVTALITAAGATALITATDIRAKADYIKSSSTDSSSVEAAEIARKIRDDIKTNHRNITISGSL